MLTNAKDNGVLRNTCAEGTSMWPNLYVSCSSAVELSSEKTKDNKQIDPRTCF